MIVDLQNFRNKKNHKLIDKKITLYRRKFHNMLILMDGIIEDMESSEINWYHAREDQKRVLENITLVALFLNDNSNLYK